MPGSSVSGEGGGHRDKRCSRKKNPGEQITKRSKRGVHGKITRRLKKGEKKHERILRRTGILKGGGVVSWGGGVKKPTFGESSGKGKYGEGIRQARVPAGTNARR